MPPNHLPVRSYLAVPVKSRSGAVLGGLFFAHQKTGVFTAADEQLILGLASQASIAIDNASLYKEAQREIEQRRRAEDHQSLLINELNHRVKNTLAIVQSLAQQSFTSRASPEAARKAFGDRLAALSAAHNLLTRQNWTEAELSQTIASSVSATLGANAQRVRMSGPRIKLPPQTAVSVAMAVHELCTNAIKYGALSNETGGVNVDWEVLPADNGSVLHFQWQEVDGPPVSLPASRGFGSRMIERGLSAELRGEVRLEFRPDGLVCTIDAPIPEVYLEAA
jgi:two-component sensor histidine kinase